ncbi:MAG: sugar phosphate isomerase/epimerase [Planctomycetota bacterium]|nr:sugar phosphate isomerase/epimerase [Planctomycetota bacterium]
MELSLFSVSYAGYWGQQSLGITDFIEKAAKLGYESVMIAGKRPHLSPLDVTSEQLDSLSMTLQQHRLKCSVIAAYTDFGSPVAAEVPYQEMQIHFVNRLTEIAATLGATAVRLFTSYESDQQSYFATWTKSVTAIQEICDFAKDRGIVIAVQNHHDLAVETTSLVEFLHDVNRDNCKLGFDAWSPALRGEDLYQAAYLAAPHTAITTNAAYVRLSRFRYRPDLINYEKAEPDAVRAVPFGTGFIDYKAFFSGLHEGGFNGIANYEMCSPIRGGGSLENLDRFASTYVAWMKNNGFAGGK